MKGIVVMATGIEKELFQISLRMKARNYSEERAKKELSSIFSRNRSEVIDICIDEMNAIGDLVNNVEGFSAEFNKLRTVEAKLESTKSPIGRYIGGIKIGRSLGRLTSMRFER